MNDEIGRPVDRQHLIDLTAEAKRLIALSKKTRQDVQNQRAGRIKMDDTPPLIVHAKRKPITFRNIRRIVLNQGSIRSGAK